jgi:hypothetical protein
MTNEMIEDAARLDWLERIVRKNVTWISFDYEPNDEGEPRGFRFVRRGFIGEAHRSLRSAIDEAMRLDPAK